MGQQMLSTDVAEARETSMSSPTYKKTTRSSTGSSESRESGAVTAIKNKISSLLSQDRQDAKKKPVTSWGNREGRQTTSTNLNAGGSSRYNFPKQSQVNRLDSNWRTSMTVTAPLNRGSTAEVTTSTRAASYSLSVADQERQAQRRDEAKPSQDSAGPQFHGDDQPDHSEMDFSKSGKVPATANSKLPEVKENDAEDEKIHEMTAADVPHLDHLPLGEMDLLCPSGLPAIVYPPDVQECSDASILPPRPLGAVISFKGSLPSPALRSSRTSSISPTAANFRTAPTSPRSDEHERTTSQSSSLDYHSTVSNTEQNLQSESDEKSGDETSGEGGLKDRKIATPPSGDNSIASTTDDDASPSTQPVASTNESIVQAQEERNVRSSSSLQTQNTSELVGWYIMPIVEEGPSLTTASATSATTPAPEPERTPTSPSDHNLISPPAFMELVGWYTMSPSSDTNSSPSAPNTGFAATDLPASTGDPSSSGAPATPEVVGWWNMPKQRCQFAAGSVNSATTPQQESPPSLAAQGAPELVGWFTMPLERGPTAQGLEETVAENATSHVGRREAGTSQQGSRLDGLSDAQPRRPRMRAPTRPSTERGFGWENEAQVGGKLGRTRRFQRSSSLWWGTPTFRGNPQHAGDESEAVILAPRIHRGLGHRRMRISSSPFPTPGSGRNARGTGYRFPRQISKPLPSPGGGRGHGLAQQSHLCDICGVASRLPAALSGRCWAHSMGQESRVRRATCLTQGVFGACCRMGPARGRSAVEGLAKSVGALPTLNDTPAGSSRLQNFIDEITATHEGRPVLCPNCNARHCQLSEHHHHQPRRQSVGIPSAVRAQILTPSPLTLQGGPVHFRAFLSGGGGAPGVV